MKLRKVEEPVAQRLPKRPRPELKRLVEVAFVVVLFVAVKDWRVVDERARMVERVEEAVEINPLLNSMVVEVAFSPVPRVLYGKAKVMEEQPVHEVTVRLPIVALFARS